MPFGLGMMAKEMAGMSWVVGGCCPAEMSDLKKDCDNEKARWQEGWPWAADCC